MAIRRKFRQRPRKMRPRKRRVIRRPKASQYANIIRPRGQFLPDRFFTEIGYDAYDSIVTVSAANAGVVPTGSWTAYRANSLWDPYFGTGGIQANGLQTFSLMYLYYRVYASKITVTANYNSATNASASYIVVGPSTNTPALTGSFISPDNLANQRYNKRLLLGDNQSGQAIKKVTNFGKMHKLFGVSKQAIRDVDGYRAQCQANPVNEVDWIITCETLSGSPTSTPTIDLNVKITYYVCFEGLIPQAGNTW